MQLSSLPMLFRRHCVILAIGAAATILVLASNAAGGTATEESAELQECRARIDKSAPRIDFRCLRMVYARPISRWPAPRIGEDAIWQEFAPLPKRAPDPAGNPSTPGKIALGKRLFEDPKLSLSGQIACSSCHDKQLGWGDGRSVSFGHDRQAGRRNAMNVANSGWSHPLFWDGRAATLEDQVIHPIADSREMAFTVDDMVARLERGGRYRQQFEEVFGDGRISADRVSRAIAAYLRSLVPRFNRFDRFLEGYQSALTDQQLWGLHLFRTRAGCMNCHSGPALTDNRFHNLGLHYYGRDKYQDLGRYEVTGDPADAGKFRTPSLRSVGKSGPYMHNGLFQNLRGVVNMYNVGMPRPQPKPGETYDPPFPETDPLLERLDLHKSELEAITEFLRTL